MTAKLYADGGEAVDHSSDLPSQGSGRILQALALANLAALFDLPLWRPELLRKKLMFWHDRGASHERE